MNNNLTKLATFLLTQKPEYQEYTPQSMLDILYTFYKEYHVTDSPLIQEAYQSLDRYVEHFPLREQDAIADIICILCTQHEKAAFLHGLKLGAQLAMELSK